jgi:hypothetical protein
MNIKKLLKYDNHHILDYLNHSKDIKNKFNIDKIYSFYLIIYDKINKIIKSRKM